MPTIEESIEVDAPMPAADRELREFGLRRAIGGYGRTEADIEFDPADDCERSGEVRLDPVAPEHTRVTLSVAYDEKDPVCEHAVRRHVHAELRRFGRYVEGRSRASAGSGQRA